MLRIGLTGGMGAGKSTVARLLVERGAVLVDSDAIAREVVEPGTPGLAALVEAFGPEILAADGSLDRPALAARAFATDAARATLNGITHPLVGRRTAELIAAAPVDAVVVQDIPLLVENGFGPGVNLVLVVTAEVETRMHRLTRFRGIAREDALVRIRAQATDEQRYAAADVLLDNNAESEALAPQVRTLWDERLVPFERNLRTRNAAVPTAPRLLDADPDRALRAQRLIARLTLAAGADATGIEHVGPTAIPGLPAPDLIDIQLTVATAAGLDTLRDRLADAGFPRAVAGGEPDDDEPSADERVHGNADPGRPARVVLRIDGSPAQRAEPALRDRLAADAALRAEFLAVERDGIAKSDGLAGAEASRVYRSVTEPWLRAARSRLLD